MKCQSSRGIRFGRTALWLKLDNASGALAFVHEVEALVDVFQRMTWVIRSSMLILPSMYQSTIFGTSVRPRAPPKAVPRHDRPVTMTLPPETPPL